MIENLIKTLARRSREHAQEPSQTPDSPEPASGEGIDDATVIEDPTYFAALNLEVRKAEDGTWTVLNKEWGCQSTQADPEKALIMMWRYIFKQGMAHMQASKSQ
jgi:hypothetical protein